MLANVIGGPITDAFGWRWACLTLGMPGVAVALIFRKTVKEPPRGHTDPPGTIRKAQARFADGLREITSKPSSWSMTAAATVASFCGYGISTLQSLFITGASG
jgi:predicted MFS family arabinose efflux permease